MKKIYITTTIGGVITAPHIGFTLELVQADVFARWHRILGKEVFFLSGADENNLKNIYIVKKKKISFKKFCDCKTGQFLKLKKALNLSYDNFIRTSDKKRHFPGAQKLWKICKNDIYKKKYKGLYCSNCEMFYRDDLKNKICPKHKTKLKIFKEVNYFFQLSKYQKRLDKLISTDKIKIIPEIRKNEVLGFIRSGLKDFSISRPVTRTKGLGIPVPNDPTQTLHAWFDALSAYLTGIGYGINTKKFKKWWPVNLQIMGKSILRFHAIYWPAILLAAGFKLPNAIFVHGFITVNGGKIKSSDNNANPFKMVEKYGTDPIRYYLLRKISDWKDGDFSIEHFEECYNTDLVNGLGNLLFRTLTMVSKYFNDKIPKINIRKTNKWRIDNQTFGIFIEKIWLLYESNFENLSLNKTLNLVWCFIKLVNSYINELQPFNSIKYDKNKTAYILYNALESLRHIAWMIRPFMPDTSDKIFIQLGIPKWEIKKPISKIKKWGGLICDIRIKNFILFPKKLL